MTISDVSKKSPIYKRLGRYLDDGGALMSTLENAFSITSQPLRITTCGLLKAGKSSLLNALTDHLETELFATGAVRTTIHNQTLSHQDFIFVDTPGLDATKDDDKEAWKGVDMADVLLFVHDPGTGELHRNEVEFLTKLATQPGGRKALEERLVVVLSRLDSNSEVISAIGQKVLGQIKDCLGVEPRLFKVSFTTYRKGMLESKKKLVEYSGVPALRQHIVENLARMRQTAQVLRQARIGDTREKLLKAIDEAIAERGAKAKHLQKKADQARQALAKDAETLFNTLRCKIAAYNDTYR